jgi:hypothetical protein
MGRGYAYIHKQWNKLFLIHIQPHYQQIQSPEMPSLLIMAHTFETT